MSDQTPVQELVQTGVSSTLQLREYHLPDPISWWPPAPGWWGIGLLILASALVVVYFNGRKQQDGWRIQAIELMDSIFRQTAQESSPHLLAKQISILLRRICKSRFPDNSGIQLVGEEWLSFLDDCAYGPEKNMSFFVNSTGQQLVRAAYDRSASTLNREELRQACLSWINNLPAKTWRE